MSLVRLASRPRHIAPRPARVVNKVNHWSTARTRVASPLVLHGTPSTFTRSYASHHHHQQQPKPNPVELFNKLMDLRHKAAKGEIRMSDADMIKYQTLEKVMPHILEEPKQLSALGYLYAPDGKRIFTREEVGRHNTDTDLWVIINDKVYNLTYWLDRHPGGMEPLRKWAGLDATEAFHRIGHSYRAKDYMANFHIGYVDSPRRFSGLGEEDPPKQLF